MDNNIDLEELRKDLIDYYGTAMFNGFPAAIADLSKVEKATPKELVKIAKNNKVDFNQYKNKQYKR